MQHLFRYLDWLLLLSTDWIEKRISTKKGKGKKFGKTKCSAHDDDDDDALALTVGLDFTDRFWQPVLFFICTLKKNWWILWDDSIEFASSGLYWKINIPVNKNKPIYIKMEITTIITASHLSGKSKILLECTQSRIPISTKNVIICVSIHVLHQSSVPFSEILHGYKYNLFVYEKFSSELLFHSLPPVTFDEVFHQLTILLKLFIKHLEINVLGGFRG
jgi:hypothetical protein